MIVKRPSADSKPQSAIREPQSSDAILQSANQNPQSAIRNPQSSVEPAARMLAERFGAFPAIAIVAGSGLGAIAERVRNAVSISYSQLPGFPVSDVAGHAGKIVVGDLAGRRVAIFCGRKHLYESITTDEATFAVRLMATAGVRRLILSNAAGGVSQRMFPGDLMLIRDHVNICHRKFVRFLKAPLGAPLGAPASLPACRQYSNHHSPAEMPALPVEAARREKIPLKEGVYCIMSGPAYETSAEVRLARCAK
ncbi:MAG: purine-nucleoside phosphorylase [Candidatus Sumerlaeota bacterium]|nr:purine-nucleoside phosphorylase [Candidatus Sumerlaeota bacterium]